MYERRRRRSKTRSQVMLQQRLMGLLLVVLSVVMLIVCAHGTTIEDRDGTGAFMVLPMGLYLIFTKKYLHLLVSNRKIWRVDITGG